MNPATAYADRAHGLKMPLVEMLRRRISWNDAEIIRDALQRIDMMAQEMDAEHAHLSGQGWVKDGCPGADD